VSIIGHQGVGHWIDATDTPPERFGLILGLARRPIVLGWSSHYRSWIDPTSGRKYKPSHWIEIPEWHTVNDDRT
jgi:hypothetical protein